MKKYIAMLLLAAALLAALSGCSISDQVAQPEQSPPSAEPSSPPPEEIEPEPDPEPDPVALQLASLTTEQKVGQLLLAGIEGLEAGEDAIYAVQTVQVGGLILFRRNIESCAQAAGLISDLKALNGTHIPLFLAADEEGGVVSRMPAEVTDLPSAAYFGQFEDEALCLQLGQALAAQCAALGLNTDFAPVSDVWSNPDNTVIGRRAYGTDPETVSRLVPQVAAGLTQGGVIPVVKHFPGHGDTAVDSHYDLPVVTKTLAELEALELIPFRAAIASGVPAVMVAHLLVRELDDALPATLSPQIVDGLLREDLGFDGVVFTDDLTMGAISNTWGIGEAAVMAVEAGCDVLLVCHGRDNLAAAREALLDAVNSGRISAQRLDESVSRILRLKLDCALNNDPVPQPDVEALNALLSPLAGT